MKGGKVVTEKYDKELEKIDAKVRELNAHKKDVEMRRENAVKAHVFGDFEKKKIPIEKFLTLSMLSKKELEGILSEAEDLSKKTDKGINDADDENRRKENAADEDKKSAAFAGAGSMRTDA